MQYRSLLVATAALSSTFSLAQSSNTVDSAENRNSHNILITATRPQSSTQTIPGNPTVIGAAELEQGGFTSVPDALGKRAGVHVRNFADNPSRTTVDLRGFGENSHGRVLVLVNGRRINRPDLGPINWAQIPMGNVDRIEVMRGAHSALYGDYAVGGVINIITKRGETTPSTEIGVTGGSYGFNDESLSTVGELAGTGYALSLGHQSADGYRDRSAYETWSGSISLESDPTDWLGSWVDYSYVDSAFELPGSLTAAQVNQDRRQAVNPDDDAEETFNQIGFGLGLYPNSTHEIILDAGLSRKDLESNLASFFSYNTWVIDTYSLSPQYILTTSPLGLDNRLTLGIDAAYDDLNVDLYGDRGHTIRNGSSQVEKATLGGYFHNELTLHESLLLSGGARVAQADYSIREKDAGGTVLQDTDDTHDVWAASVGLTYLPADPLKFFVRVDRLYRLPFLDEQISYFGFGSSFNKDLGPETGLAYELGTAYSPSEALELQGTLFRMDMNDEIGFDPITFSNMNMDETRHQGVELAANWHAFSNLMLHGRYTLQQVEFTDGPNDGNEVPLVPRNLLSAGLDVRLIGELHMLADVMFTDEQYAGGATGNAAGTELKDYTVVDIALTYTCAFRNMETRLFAGIDNLFSEEYSPVGYAGFGPTAYYPAPERTYTAGVKMRF